MLVPRIGVGLRSAFLPLALVCGLFLSPDRAAAQSYSVDTSASRIYVKVGKATTIGHEHGIEGNLASGQVTLGGSGELVFDMKSLAADTAAARGYVGLSGSLSDSDVRKVNDNMRGPDVLAVSSHPTATFTFSSATPLDGQKAGEPGRYSFAGQFTLRGVTRPVQFVATAKAGPQAGQLSLRGSFSLWQSHHGIKPCSALGGFVKVADQLDVWGDLVLTPSR